MSTLTLVDNLRKALKPYQALLAAVDQLEALGQLEQTEAETKARLAAVQAQELAAQGRLDALRSDLARGKAEVQAARDRAAEIVAAATSEADQLVRQGEVCRVDAQLEADRLLAEANSFRASAKAEIADLEIRRAALAGELAAFEDNLRAAKAKLAAQLGL